MRCAAYYRVSTDEQGASLDAQEAGARAWCERNGGELVAEYRDEGVSGAEWLRRPGVAALQADVQQDPLPWDVLVVRDLDRLGRDTLRLGLLIETLHDHNARLIVWSTGEEVKPDPMARALLLLRSVLAEQERSQIAHRTRTGLQQRAERGMCVGGRPYGYDLVRGPDGVRYVVNEAEAAVVREIYARRAAGESARAVAGDLNRRGVPSARAALSCAWHPTQVLNIAGSTRYRGVATWGRSGSKYKGGTRVAVTHGDDAVINYPVAPIVDDDLWQRAQTNTAAASKPKGAIVHRGTAPRYLMVGNAVCGLCGGPIGSTRAGTTIGGEPTHVPAYTCGRAKDQDRCSFKARRPIERLDGPVIDWMLAKVLDPDVIRVGIEHANAEALAAKGAPGNPKADELRARIDDIERRIGRLVPALEDDDTGAVRAALRARQAELTAARREFDALAAPAVATTDDVAALLSRIADLRQLFEAARRERPDLVRRVLGKVLVRPIKVTPEGSGRAMRMHLTGEAAPGALLDVHVGGTDGALLGLHGAAGGFSHSGPPDMLATHTGVSDATRGMFTTPGR